MSNPGKPSESVTTRWWWVRHAPVRSDGGNIYGQKDIACDTSDTEVFEAVAKILPRNAVWYCKQPEAHASDRGSDLGRGLSEACKHDAGEGLRRTTSRRMAGDEPRGVPRKPAGRSATGLPQSTNPRPAAKVSWISITACAVRSSGSMPNRPARTSSQSPTAAPSRPPSVWRSAVSREGAGIRHRQLFGDAARSSRKRRHQQLAASDGQPAAVDRGCLARRDASAGRAGSRAGNEARLKHWLSNAINAA